MADLALWKKYPAEGEEGEDSYRLDHPHFQNVQRVTYAKGVITDFKKVQDNPIKVESLVKVEIEGYGETDYIPLFYHPKPLYWDDEEAGIKATDIDEEQKMHKMAWTSFRCSDEVVVVMEANAPGEELEPKAVIGFTDNYPRIGEDIFKVETPEALPDYISCLNLTWYPWEFGKNEVGYDGKPLNLVVKAEKVEKEGPDWDEDEEWRRPRSYFAPNQDLPVNCTDLCSCIGGTSFTINICYNPIFGAGATGHYEGDPCWTANDESNLQFCIDNAGWGMEQAAVVTDDVWVFQKCNKFSYWASKVIVWLVIVGPILYAVYMLVAGRTKYEKTEYSRDTTTWQYWDQSKPYYRDLDGQAYYIKMREFLMNYGEEPPGRSIREGIGIPGYGYDIPWHEVYQSEPSDWDVVVKAGIYTPELYEAAKNQTIDVKECFDKLEAFWDIGEYHGDWTPPLEGLVHQVVEMSNLVYSATYDDSDMYYRPHTKEELVEHGFLNEDGTLPEE